MNPRKTILLPADTRILHLQKDVIAEEKKPVEESQRSIFMLYVTVLRVIYLVVFLPVVLLFFLWNLVYLFVAKWKKGKDGEQQVFDQMDRFFKWIEGFRPYTKKEDTSVQVKQPEEDVPALLNDAKRYGYRRVVYTFQIEESTAPGWIKLCKDGWIDDILYFINEQELIRWFTIGSVDTRHSYILRTAPWQKGLLVPVRTLFIKPIEPGDDFQSTSPTFNKCRDRIMFSRIKLPYNTLLDESVLLYFEQSYNPQWNEFFRMRYKEIQSALAQKGLRLLYFPVLTEQEGKEELYRNLLTYLHPDHFVGESRLSAEQLRQWISELNIEGLYAALGTQFSIPPLEVPCLIHCVERLNEVRDQRAVYYSCTPLWAVNEVEMLQEWEHYLRYVRYPESQLYFSLATRDESDYDADEWFPKDGSKLSVDLMDKIRSIRNETPEEKMLETLFHIINSFRDLDPKLVQQLNRHLYEALPGVSTKSSRLLIDRQFRIFLPDYGNIEIEMTPLPKTLFLLLLKYPEGILFKELYKYKDELLYIYGRIGNRTDMEQMLKSIGDITDARSNSVNEKASRIKEAFLSKIDERVASAYFITGNRQEPKRIVLDRSLVIFEDQL